MTPIATRPSAAIHLLSTAYLKKKMMPIASVIAPARFARVRPKRASS